MNKKLGIISGAGAFSGLFLYEKILKSISALGIERDKDFPQIILHNYPFESMNETGIENIELAHLELTCALKPLKECEKIIIACNTLHLIHEEERLISLPELILKELSLINEKALILCSQSSKQYKLFGEDYFYLDNLLLDFSNKIILDKLKGISTNEQQYINSVINQAQQLGVNTIVVGCTELSMIDWKFYLYPNFKFIDGVELATKQVLDWHLTGEKNESL
jgi:aspartate/glutamate racemase